MNAYVGFYEEVFSEKFDKIPDEHKGTLGLIVGGFSPGAFLSEVWQILIPWHSTQRSPSRFYAPGEFGGASFAANDPILRYMNGIDLSLSTEILAHIEKLLGRSVTQAEKDDYWKLIQQYRYPLMVDAMPIQAGVDWVRFQLNLVIGHYRSGRSATPYELSGRGHGRGMGAIAAQPMACRLLRHASTVAPKPLGARRPNGLPEEGERALLCRKCGNGFRRLKPRTVEAKRSAVPECA